MNQKQPAASFLLLLGLFACGIIFTIVGFLTLPILIGIVFMPLGILMLVIGFIGLCLYIPVKIAYLIHKGIKTKKK